MKLVLRIAAALIIVLVAVAAGIWLFFDANQFRPMLEAELTKALDPVEMTKPGGEGAAGG